MGKTIQELINESSDFKRIQTDRQNLVARWEDSGLLTGLKNGSKNQFSKNGMAQLLENQAKILLREASNDSDVGGFMNVAFPLVRRTFGPLFAQELVSVQPMSLPAGLLFYLDFTYAKSVGMYTAGGSVFGNPVGAAVAESGNLGTGGPYLLRDSYSQRIVSASFDSIAGARTDGVAGTVTGSAVNADVNYDPTLVGVTLKYLMVSTASLTSSVGSFDSSQLSQVYIVTGSAVHYRQHNEAIYGALNELSYIKCYFSDALVFSAVTGPSEGSFVVKPNITESKGVTMSPVWETDFAVSPTPAIREVNIKINSISVVATDRKLAAKWSPEMAQDLNAYHNLDAEVEITQILSEQITLDIDLEILDMLVKASLGKGSACKKYWSRRVGKYVDENTGAATPNPNWYGTRREWYETLIETVNSASNEIYRKTLRGRGNFIVCSPKIQTMLQSTALWRANVSADVKENAFTVGMEKVGSLDNRYNVYVSPYFYENLILVGYKGTSWLDVGAAYCPYVPLIMTPTIFSPEDYSPRKGLMTRYAKQVVNPAFYANVIVEDIMG